MLDTTLNSSTILLPVAGEEYGNKLFLFIPECLQLSPT